MPKLKRKKGWEMELFGLRYYVSAYTKGEARKLFKAMTTSIPKGTKISRVHGD